MPLKAHRQTPEEDVILIMYVPFDRPSESWKLTKDVSLLGNTGAGKSHVRLDLFLFQCILIALTVHQYCRRVNSRPHQRRDNIQRPFRQRFQTSTPTI